LENASLFSKKLFLFFIPPFLPFFIVVSHQKNEDSGGFRSILQKTDGKTGANPAFFSENRE